MSNERYYKLHPDLAIGPSKFHGQGTFATRRLGRGTLLLVIGGHIATLKEEAGLPHNIQDAGVQVASDLVLTPRTSELAGGIGYVNHCCDPNAGFHGQIFLVAIRDIAQGEEVSFDYAMCLGDSPHAAPYRLECHCGSTLCRGWITDRDWAIPVLQARYRGFFQPYLQARIEQRSELLLGPPQHVEPDLAEQRSSMSSPPPEYPKCDSEFIKQLPDWEKEYKQSNELAIHYTPEQWKTARPEFSEHDLRILGEPVMEDWEEPYMRVLADIATENGGVVLEIGYGMGISARFIQQAQIDWHLIIEANQAVARKARKWATTCSIATLVLEGLWQEALLLIPDDSLDGILFDTYPLTEKELYQNHFGFFPHAFAKLKKGGLLTYYSDETRWFSEIHIKRLTMAGFSAHAIDGKTVAVSPPEDCEYWKSKTILAPIIRK